MPNNHLLQTLTLLQALLAKVVKGKRAGKLVIRFDKIAGAASFSEKPIGYVDLLTSLERAVLQAQAAGKISRGRDDAASHLATLTERQHQIMALVLAGHPSKNIAADLGISQRTVENHRASIMKKTGSKSLPALARLVLAGGAAASE
jgi:two-component system CheB/CheR fusion protein